MHGLGEKGNGGEVQLLLGNSVMLPGSEHLEVKLQVSAAQERLKLFQSQLLLFSAFCFKTELYCNSVSSHFFSSSFSFFFLFSGTHVRIVS